MNKSKYFSGQPLVAQLIKYLDREEINRINNDKKQNNKDLRFNEKDFNDPSTYDLIFNYFKTKHPNDWEEKCAVLLGMGLSKLKAYYKTRENFYNR